MSLKVHVIEVTSDPVAAPEFVGQHWINTSTGKQWLASGTSSISDWAEIQSPANLAETVRDTIGSALTDSSSIDFTANDVADTITATVIPGGVDHDQLANFVANKHINHATVNIVAGTGLSGGGDITASRTLNIANTGVVAGTYGTADQIPTITINSQGQITAVSVNTAVGSEWTELCTTSTYTNSSNITGVGITELDVTVISGNRYYYEATLLFQTAATTTGIGVTVTSPNGASAPGALMVNVPIAADGTAAGYTGTINSLGDYVTSTGVQTANATFVCNLKGAFAVTTGGTLRLTFRSEVLTSTVTILPGSTVLMREFV